MSTGAKVWLWFVPADYLAADTGRLGGNALNDERF